MEESVVQIKVNVCNPLTVEQRVQEGIRTWKADYLIDTKGINGKVLKSIDFSRRDCSISDSGQSKVES